MARERGTYEHGDVSNALAADHRAAKRLVGVLALVDETLRRLRDDNVVELVKRADAVETKGGGTRHAMAGSEWRGGRERGGGSRLGEGLRAYRK
jgi:hypothetical protein